jgi:hypothetical protein
MKPHLDDAPAPAASKPEEKQSYLNAPMVKSHFDAAKMDIPDLGLPGALVIPPKPI